MKRSRERRTVLRSVVLGAALLVLLAAAYLPARDVFRSTADVDLYQRYARGVLDTPPQLPREYPPLTVAVFVIPHLLTPNTYMLGFALLCTFAAWLVVLLVDRLGNGGGWWLVLLIALSAWGTMFFRFDIVVVLLTVLAFWAGTHKRWFGAQVLLALGVALKLYPLLLMPLVVVWQWRTTRRVPWRSVLGGAATLAVAGGAMWWLAPAQVLAMLQYHGERPLEFESLGASVVWLLSPVTVESSFGSLNVVSPLAPAVIARFNLLQVIILVALYAGFVAGYLRPAAAWALTLLFALALNKVFSTQYILWALPFVVLAVNESQPDRCWSRAYLGLWALICLLTSLIFPIGTTVTSIEALMNVVTLRNGLWLVACGAAVILWLAPRRRVTVLARAEAP
jgi:hypothetical protein